MRWIAMTARLLAILLLLSASGQGVGESDAERSAQQDCVVLLHGLFRSANAMRPLQWFLEFEGYATVNESYPSLLYSIEELAETAVEAGFNNCRRQGHRTVHFVTHSLGGILVRQYASRHPFPPATRVVMLGPPNQGSQVADYYHTLDIMPGIELEAMRELSGGDNSLPGRLGPVNFQLGVIAGDLRSWTLLPGFPDIPSDGTVAVAEAVVPGMVDFLTMPVTHTFMIWNPQVMSQVLHFLRHGVFDRS